LRNQPKQRQSSDGRGNNSSHGNQHNRNTNQSNSLSQHLHTSGRYHGDDPAVQMSEIDQFEQRLQANLAIPYDLRDPRWAVEGE
jgi:hypothetical protein